MVQNSGEDNHLVPLKNIGNVKNDSSKIRAFVATRDKYKRAQVPKSPCECKRHQHKILESRELHIWKKDFAV